MVNKNKEVKKMSIVKKIMMTVSGDLLLEVESLSKALNLPYSQTCVMLISQAINANKAKKALEDKIPEFFNNLAKNPEFAKSISDYQKK